MRFEFDWDPAKAATNRAKHRGSFDEAMTVFGDPLALSLPDRDHGEAEERRATLGLSSFQRLLVVVHTYVEISPEVAHIRLISARTPTRRETKDYEENPQ